MAEFPPRGAGPDKREPDVGPSASWGHPWQLGSSWDWKEGGILLGEWKGRLLGRDDDRHVVTIAGSRAGKSRTVLIPNLLRYRGPAVIIDPKGELAAATAREREKFGPVHILDPFGESGFATASHNPFEELKRSGDRTLSADAAQMADALIIDSEGDKHWTDSAKNLIGGIIMHALTRAPDLASLPALRRVLNDNTFLADVAIAMAKSDALGGAVSNAGRAVLGKMGQDGSFSNEMRSIISTATEQTRPLDDVAAITGASDFALADLSRQHMTIYLVLPALRLATHGRWLRLFLSQALAALERNPVPRGQRPVWFVLEEFATLGNMRMIESAAGYMAGFGVKLWVVLQDLTQIKTHYRHSWETFLGNAGIIQAFGNVDHTTTDYLSQLLGQTTILENHDVRLSAHSLDTGDTGKREQPRVVRLLEPSEIALYFSRDTGRSLILCPGRPPVYLDRLKI
jgi:type IV secretion system protein VirD4